MLERYEWLVSGMDCQACGAKVQGALERISGIQHVEVFPFTQKLRVSLNPNPHVIEMVKQTVTDLGYTLTSTAPENVSTETVTGDDFSQKKAKSPWYKGEKGRLVATTGILLAIAWSVVSLLPEYFRDWPFAAACLIGLLPVVRKAWAALWVGQPFTIEALMTIAAVGALAIGAVQEAALVVFLFSVGELLEGLAVDHARNGIRALGKLIPTTALLEVGETTQEVPASQLVPGEVIRVRPGDRIAADGTILSGTGGVDESPVTGESVPVTRGPGDAVFAGAINTEVSLRVQVARAAADNTIARIIRLVEQAEESRAPTERFIDRFSRWYMPSIVGLSVIVAIVPPLLLAQAWPVWIYRGLSLLLIGCPCALVISVPAAVASALSAGARRGLLLKGGAVIEATAKIKTVALDKTGTLTMGHPDVTDVITLADMSENECLSVAAAIENTSSHPLAKAIVRKASGLVLPNVESGQAIPGKGVTATIEGQLYTIASPRHAAQDGVLPPSSAPQVHALEEEGKTVAVLYAERALAFIALRDEPRADAGAAIRELRLLGLTSIILTGDNKRTAAAIAASLGADFEAELLPEQKLAAIQKLSTKGPIMMVGDGINDAPALKQASVGVAIGSGTDVALETADAAILRDRVTDVPDLVRLARATMRNIRQNVSLALGLKAAFLVTSILGITGLWLAIMADTGATVLVTLNALRLLRMGRQSAST
ncbi:MAG: heavy metal translocating P-type ATPase [Gluconobacter cerinus]|uniref:heavy metal translocating P-type ATPase n=1 Tax=Gluconobacter cerinus TaxID=38307 RepID=UPI0039EBBB7B